MLWDILVISVLILSAIIAFFRGFVREVLTIAGVVGGVAGAVYFGNDAKPAFRSLFGVNDQAEDAEKAKLFDLIPYELVADGLAYGTIFLVIVIILSVISHYLAAATKKSGLGLLDRTLGVLFGVVRGILLLGLVYLPVHIFVEVDTKKQWFEQSRSIVYVELTANFLTKFFPDFEKEPEMMFDARDVKKVIKARELIREMDNKVKQDADKKLDEKGADENGKEATAGQGYEDELRQQMKDLLKDVPVDDTSSPENSPSKAE